MRYIKCQGFCNRKKHRGGRGAAIFHTPAKLLEEEGGVRQGSGCALAQLAENWRSLGLRKMAT